MSRPTALPAASPAPGDSHAVGRHFGGAARTYDAHADVQLSAARALLALLPGDLHPARALDLGAGTAPMARRLQERLPQTQWLALDIALPMLQEAQIRGRLNERYAAVCADVTRLPLGDGGIDLLYSSFALQWCQQLPELAAELTRVAAPGAALALCVPVVGTLQELRDSWAEADNAPHVNRFHTLQDWEAAFVAAGWYTDTAHQWQVQQHYSDVRAISGMLRATGAHHVFRSQPQGLTGRRRLQAMLTAYETRRTAEGLPVTWQIGQLVLRRP
ncbi:MAG: malonyl-ACP O-methyltransferase BioC [Alcanivorax sp.]|nr:malonyl-ACP O-methyltransferase BioC [Alcanivorax sp.]